MTKVVTGEKAEAECGAHQNCRGMGALGTDGAMGSVTAVVYEVGT